MTRTIAICTPIHRHTHADFTASLLKTFRAAPNPNNLAWLNIVGEPNIAHARNILVSEALRRNVSDIVFIDSDIGWEPDAFDMLFDAPADCRIIAGAPERRDAHPVNFCSVRDTTNARQKGRLVSGFAATAFLRIDAALFNELEYPKLYHHRQGVCKSWFFYDIGTMSEETATDQFIASDFYFSLKCRKAGYDVWIDPEIRLRHYNEVALTARMVDHF